MSCRVMVQGDFSGDVAEVKASVPKVPVSKALNEQQPVLWEDGSVSLTPASPAIFRGHVSKALEQQEREKDSDPNAVFDEQIFNRLDVTAPARVPVKKQQSNPNDPNSVFDDAFGIAYFA